MLKLNVMELPRCEPRCFNVLRRKAVAQHYLNQLASTWDRLDPFQIPKCQDTFRNLQQFREARCLMVSVCNDMFCRSAACFNFHPSMGSCTQNTGFTARLLISQRGRLPGHFGICCMARWFTSVPHMEIENSGVPKQFKRMVNGQGSWLPSSPLRETELMAFMHVWSKCCMCGIGMAGFDLCTHLELWGYAGLWHWHSWHSRVKNKSRHRRPCGKHWERVARVKSSTNPTGKHALTLRKRHFQTFQIDRIDSG